MGEKGLRFTLEPFIFLLWVSVNKLGRNMYVVSQNEIQHILTTVWTHNRLRRWHRSGPTDIKGAALLPDPIIYSNEYLCFKPSSVCSKFEYLHTGMPLRTGP